MQIDFHHAATYVVARLGGMDHAAASVVAYAAQYVDDAVQAGMIGFDDGGSYERHSSAHKALDYKNLQAVAQSRVWIPFHFLPGNGGLPPGADPEGGRIAKLVTVPDSHPARDLIRLVIAARNEPWALHRLGITMHVYADTWAHQGFCGVPSEINDATDLSFADGRLATTWSDRVRVAIVRNALPLGHGTVLSLPDRPYLRWRYKNGHGVWVDRDNPRDYLAAADRMCQVIRGFVAGDADTPMAPLPDADRQVIWALLNTEGEWEARHTAWLEAIAAGRFSFGPAEIRYVDRGPGSWKHDALGTDEVGDDVPLRPSFFTSDYKRFHDAAEEHRFDVLHRVLPKYGILAA